jgi:molybdopterin-guanine dinucleotide biosynthesis protein A
MGAPKAALPYGDKSFIELVAAALAPHVERLFLLGEIRGTPRIPVVAEHLTDATDVSGPMAGMLAALRFSPPACWVLVACDLPLMSAAAVAWLISQRGPGRAAVLPSLRPGTVEPLGALYEPGARELLERLAAQGIASPHRLAESPGVVAPEPPPELATCWTNINSPAEFAALRGRI